MCTERLKAKIPLLSFVLNCSAQYFPILQYMVLYRETPKVDTDLLSIVNVLSI